MRSIRPLVARVRTLLPICRVTALSNAGADLDRRLIRFGILDLFESRDELPPGPPCQTGCRDLSVGGREVKTGTRIDIVRRR